MSIFLALPMLLVKDPSVCQLTRTLSMHAGLISRLQCTTSTTSQSQLTVTALVLSRISTHLSVAKSHRAIAHTLKPVKLVTSQASTATSQPLRSRRRKSHRTNAFSPPADLLMLVTLTSTLRPRAASAPSLATARSISITATPLA